MSMQLVPSPVLRRRVTLVAGIATLLGIGFTAGAVLAGQPHMYNALNALRNAKHELEVAEHNKGGHRATALRLVDDAIGEVKAGIAVGGD